MSVSFLDLLWRCTADQFFPHHEKGINSKKVGGPRKWISSGGHNQCHVTLGEKVSSAAPVHHRFLPPLSFISSGSPFLSSSAKQSTSSLAMISTRTLSVAMLALTALFSFSLFATPADATALTYRLMAHEKACFYAWADVPRKKVSIYFAVSRLGGSNKRKGTRGSMDPDLSLLLGG